MKVMVDTEILKSKNKDNIENTDDFYNAVLGIRNLSDNLGNSWSGLAYKEFRIRIQDFCDSLNKLGSSLDEFNDFIAEYVSGINEIENEYNSKTIDIN